MGDRQSKRSIEKNREFFDQNIAYERAISQIDTYQALRSAVNRAIVGMRDIVDVGNGGVFDYDLDALDHITAVDLFLDSIDSSAYPPHVTFVQGSALNLPLPTASADGVVIVMLIHHLVGNDVRQCHENLKQCLDEARRVIRPGGRLVLIESCVPRWFYALERLAFKPAVRVIDRITDHPITFQYTIDIVERAVMATFGNATVEHVPKGKYVLQFGVKVPSFVSPVEPYLIVANRTD